MTAAKRPAFQFYPADWRKDVELRACSVAARGLWMDLLCVMHECEPYGHLAINGKAMTVAQIAGQVGLAPAQCRKLLDELLENGVARKTIEGTVFSKRMVDDERARIARAEVGRANGEKGGEFGSLGAEHGKKGGRPRKVEGVLEPAEKPPQNPHPSSSSSSSNGERESAGDPKPEPTDRGKIGMAMKAAGLPPTSFNLGDPVFMALVDQGATAEEFAGLASEALSRGIGHPWGWILATLPGRRASAAKVKLAPAQKPIDPFAGAR